MIRSVSRRSQPRRRGWNSSTKVVADPVTTTTSNPRVVPNSNSARPLVMRTTRRRNFASHTKPTASSLNRTESREANWNDNTIPERVREGFMMRDTRLQIRAMIESLSQDKHRNRKTSSDATPTSPGVRHRQPGQQDDLQTQPVQPTPNLRTPPRNQLRGPSVSSFPRRWSSDKLHYKKTKPTPTGSHHTERDIFSDKPKLRSPASLETDNLSPLGSVDLRYHGEQSQPELGDIEISDLIRSPQQKPSKAPTEPRKEPTVDDSVRIEREPSVFRNTEVAEDVSPSTVCPKWLDYKLNDKIIICLRDVDDRRLHR